MSFWETKEHTHTQILISVGVDINTNKSPKGTLQASKTSKSGLWKPKIIEKSLFFFTLSQMGPFSFVPLQRPLLIFS